MSHFPRAKENFDKNNWSGKLQWLKKSIPEEFIIPSKEYYPFSRKQSTINLLVLTSGLYYKHIMIVNDDSSVINKWWVSLTDDITVVILDRNMFIILAIVQFLTSMLFLIKVKEVFSNKEGECIIWPVWSRFRVDRFIADNFFLALCTHSLHNLFPGWSDLATFCRLGYFLKAQPNF